MRGCVAPAMTWSSTSVRPIDSSHTPSIASRHITDSVQTLPELAMPLNGYSISPLHNCPLTLSGSALRKVWVLIKLQALVYDILRSTFGGRCRKAMLGVWVLITLWKQHSSPSRPDVITRGASAADRLKSSVSIQTIFSGCICAGISDAGGR